MLRIRFLQGMVGLAISVGLLATGCASRQGPPLESRVVSSTTAPPISRYSMAELASRPCLALDERDLAALGITGEGKEEPGEGGTSCMWQVADQNVSLRVNLPLSYAQTMTKNGRVSQVPVGQHNAVQAEFQGICFIFVAVDDTDHLVGATAIPEPGAPQEGACPAAATVAAAALTHLE
jgi:hypothetical protein